MMADRSRKTEDNDRKNLGDMAIGPVMEVRRLPQGCIRAVVPHGFTPPW